MIKKLIFILASSALSAHALPWASAEDQLYKSNKELQSLESQVQAQNFRKGYRASLWLPEVNVKGGYQDENTIEDQYQGYVGFLEGRWMLYAGGADQARYQNQNLEYQILDLSLQRKRKTLKRELAEVYYNLWIQDESLKLWKERQDLLKEQRTMAKRKINAGLSSDVDALEIDLEENVAEAEVEGFKHSKERLLAELQKLLPSTPVENFQVNLNDLPSKPAESTESVEALVQKSSWVQQSRLSTEQSLNVRKESLAAFIPHLELGARYGRITPEYDNPWEGRESQVALLVSWNLFSGGTKWNNWRASKNDTVARETQSQQESLRLYSELTSLRSQLAEKQHLQGLLKKREKASQSYYNLTLSEYRRGIKNSADLASATRGVFDTKQKLIVIETEIAILGFKMDELI